MGTKPSDVVSGIGVFASIFPAVDKEIQTQCGGSRQLANEAWYRLGKPEGEAKLREWARIAVDIEQPETYRVIVKPSFEEMLRFANQAWVDSDFTEEHFPFAPCDFGEFNPELVHLGRVVSTQEVITYMRGQHLIPVNHAVLLGIAGTYPHLQLQFPLVALGSSWLVPGGDRSVPYLCRDGDSRRLRLRYGGNDWSVTCRFPALRIK